MAARPAQSDRSPHVVSPQLLCACYEVARWLYAPAEVWPYLRQELQGGARPPRPADRLEDLLRWVRRRVERVEDAGRFLHPERWRSPGEALWHGSAGSAELALLLWSAAPLAGLPRGRLVIGTCGDAPHAWVEWPELGLYADAAVEVCGALGALPGDYAERLTIWPPLLQAEPEQRPAA